MKAIPPLVEFVQIGVGRELGVEDELAGKLSGVLLPELDKPQDLVVLVGFAHFGIGRAEDTGVGIPGEEGQEALLPAASLGHVVFLDPPFVTSGQASIPQGIFPVEGDRMKVEVERGAPLQPQGRGRLKPKAHEVGVA
jgi:hypothetical protein